MEGRSSWLKETFTSNSCQDLPFAYTVTELFKEDDLVYYQYKILWLVKTSFLIVSGSHFTQWLPEKAANYLFFFFWSYCT